MEKEFEKKFAASLSIASNGLIIVFKLIVGIISGSISIISEAVHSISDFLASILTCFAVVRSSRPADNDHPFGHGRYEDVAGFIEGILIVLASFYIVFESYKKTLRLNPTSSLYLVLLNLILFVSKKLLLYIFP